MPKFFTQFDPPPVEGLRCSLESNVQQHMKDECDINKLIERYTMTGGREGGHSTPGFYGDFTAIDYQNALDVVALADEQFMSLPAAVRDRFSNNPAKLLHFLEDESNRAEAERLGLVKVSGNIYPLDVNVPTDTTKKQSEVILSEA